jgi:hypothetical protein
VTNPISYESFQEARRMATDSTYADRFKGWYRDEKNGRVFALFDFGKRLGMDGQEAEEGMRFGIRGKRYIDNVSRIVNETEKTYDVKTHSIKEARHFTKLEENEAGTLWDAEVAAAPQTETERNAMLVGVILPIWDRIEGSSRVYRLQTDDGERYLGRWLIGRESERTLKNLGVGSRVSRLSAAEQFRAIEGGARTFLANGWEIKSSLVSGEKRIEIVPRSAYLSAAETAVLRQQGAFVERISWQERVFIPTGARGPEVFGRIVESKPVVEITGMDGEDAQLSAADQGSGSTPDEVRSALARKLGGRIVRGLERSGFLRIVNSDDPGLPAAVARSGKGGYLKVQDRVWLVADRLRDFEIWPTVLHEVGEHASLREMLGDRYAELTLAFDRLVAARDATAVEVARLVDVLIRDGTVMPQHRDSERLAYFLEVTGYRAEQPAGNLSRAVRRLLARIVAAIRVWLFQTPVYQALAARGVNLELSPNDLLALAERAVRWRAGRVGESMPAARPQAAGAMQAPGGLQSTAARALPGFLSILGDAEPDLALRQIQAMTGMRWPMRWQYTTALGSFVSAALDRDSGVILLNSNHAFNQASLVQVMLEEWLHDVDSLSGTRAISVSSPRLLPGGDMFEEAAAYFRGNGQFVDFLRYPLGYGFDRSRTAAELFARLGVIYFSDPAAIREELPIAYGVYHGIFGFSKTRSGRYGLSPKVWREAAGWDSENGGGSTTVQQIARRLAQRVGYGRPDRRLGRLRAELVSAFAGRPEGGFYGNRVAPSFGQTGEGGSRLTSHETVPSASSTGASSIHLRDGPVGSTRAQPDGETSDIQLSPALEALSAIARQVREEGGWSTIKQALEKTQAWSGLKRQVLGGFTPRMLADLAGDVLPVLKERVIPAREGMEAVQVVEQTRYSKQVAEPFLTLTRADEVAARAVFPTGVGMNR